MSIAACLIALRREKSLTQLDPQEKTGILGLIDGLLLKHNAKRWTAHTSGYEEITFFNEVRNGNAKRSRKTIDRPSAGTGQLG